MPHIAILGAGAVGTALATNWAARGHEITFGVRDADSESARKALNMLGGRARGTHFADAVTAGDVVVLALPWRAVEATLAGVDDFGGRVLIDATNPLEFVDGSLRLAVGHTTSGGERVAEWARGARVVKTLNQIGAERMAEPSALSPKPVMFAAGDDPEAREEALALIADLGFEAQDFGPLAGARLLEPFALTWIHMALVRGELLPVSWTGSGVI
ncbi:NADPH-dependent F420 reductase [Salibaculum halophilum]|uniref:NADPH-dependent F420 reductase n=1 Tax=Salibaculum halophilum TaxID=1914408 RepID=UPI000A0FD891|nr:NAD(P)-binding domain-containing protein [Salibaculum halophilum]